jgi:FtsH-binding integral membrane protein
MGFNRYQTLPAAGLVRSGAEVATLVRRTYALVLASVVVTMGGVWFGLSQPSMMEAVIRHPFITMLCAFAPLFGAQAMKDRFPANIGLVFMFTFVEGLWISPFIALYEKVQPGVVGQAGLLTLSAFTVLTIYAFVSRRDFSAWGSFLFVGLIVLILTSLLNAFFGNATGALWIAAVGVLLFSGLLVFDTWRLRNVYGPNDYVPAAVNIYLDLLNMFMFVLQLLGGGRRN